jgi:hypothetical protein
MHDFLDMITEGLLVVKKQNKTERDRITSEEVYTRLGRILAKCEESVDYATKAAPRAPEVSSDENAIADIPIEFIISDMPYVTNGSRHHARGKGSRISGEMWRY